MATTTGHAGQVTVTITAASSGATADSLDIASSTLSLIYIYSTSTSSEPTEVASSPSRTKSHHQVSGGAIAGIVVGSVAFIIILALSLFCYSRHVARKRRAEMASQHPSRHTAESQAYSRATMMQGPGASTNGRTTRNSDYAKSLDELSMAHRSLQSPDLLPRCPPQELPTAHNRPELEGSGRMYKLRSKKSARTRPKPGIAEVYGSVDQPVELQAGSMTNLVAEIQELKRVKVSSSDRGSSRRWQDKDSDFASGGNSSPRFPPPSRTMSCDSGLMSDTDGTETEYGTADGASIHIYYRSSAATIAAAMSQASLIKGSRSTMGSNSPVARLA